MQHLITITVELARHDADVTGAYGEVVWIDYTTCHITTDTDRYAALMRRLEQSECAEIVEVEDH